MPSLRIQELGGSALKQARERQETSEGADGKRHLRSITSPTRKGQTNPSQDTLKEIKLKEAVAEGSQL
ncbi:hypothetical protein MTO96_038993 [Rhipicephalus appendiculatus]